MKDISVSARIASIALLAVLCPALHAAPRLLLSATTVAPARISPGANGSPQIVDAQNAGDGTLNLSATSSASWLSATVGSPKACTVLSGTCNPVAISLSTASLTAGTYTEFITLTDPNAVDTPQDITVTVVIAGVPDSVTLYAGPYGSGSSQPLQYIYPASPVKGIVATATGGPWLTFSPTGSNPFVNLPNTILATVPPGLGAGTYTGTVTISGSTLPADNKVIAVKLVVTTSPILDLSSISTVRFFGYQGGDKPYPAVISFPNLGPGVVGISGAASSAAFLTATASGSNFITIIADPTTLAAGSYSATVTITSNAANNAAVSIPVEFVVYPVGPSVISAGGVVNAATYVSEAFAPGDIVSVFGIQLAPAGTAATNPGPPPLANKLGNVQLLVNGVPAPLYYTSPKQINFQVPYSAVAGQVMTVQAVSNGVPGNVRSMKIAASIPRILVVGGNNGVAINATDGSLALSSSLNASLGCFCHPAKPGDVLIIYGIGFGQTSPPAQEGNPSTAVPLQYAPLTNVTFGGAFAGPPSVVANPFSGLSPTFVGLYQINVAVPPDSPQADSLPLSVTVGGALSNEVRIAVSATGR